MATSTESLVLFGNGTWAEFVAYLLINDSNYDLVAFTVDEKYVGAGTLMGRPVVPFEEVEQYFSPDSYLMMNCAGFVAGNRLRADRYAAGKAKGYRFGSYVSSRASVWPNIQVGENCFIHEHAVIQPFATVGANTQILSGAQVSHHTQVGRHCFVASGVAVGGNCTVGDYSFLAMNSVVRDNTKIAGHSTLGAGSTLISDAERAGVYVGSPAQWIRETV